MQNQRGGCLFILLLLPDTLRQKLLRLLARAAVLLEAGQCLADVMEVFDNSPVNLPASDIAKCNDLYIRFCQLTEDVEELLTPKRHLFTHLLEGLGYRGNPKFYANWRDESLNKLLRSSCRQLSQTTFEGTFLIHMTLLLEDEMKKDKVRKRAGR